MSRFKAKKFALYLGFVCGVYFLIPLLQWTFCVECEPSQATIIQIDKIRLGMRPRGLADELKQIKNNQTMSFLYTTPDHQTASKPLKLSPTQAKQLGWDEPIDYIKLTKENVEQFVFVTAANYEYYNYALGFLETVLKVKPNHTVYFYDLGLTSAQIQKIKGMESCGVKYRKFYFENYPDHMKKLYTCAWKPIIIMEVLRHEPGVFWTDTSVRFYSGDFGRMHSGALRNEGIATLSNTLHSTYASTHPNMFDFLPVDAGIDKRERQQEAGLVFYYRTKFVVEKILFWGVLCALNKDCISPEGAKLECILYGDAFVTYMGCHRYDQSMLNILLLNLFRISRRMYAGDPRVLGVWRRQMPTSNVSGCVKDAIMPEIT